VDVEVVGFPVDERVDLCKPGFAEEKVVIFSKGKQGD
jgi:hypothetical protein